MDGRATAFCHGGGSLCMQFGNLNFNGGAPLSTGDMHPAVNDRTIAAAQMQIVLIDEFVGHLKKRNLSDEAAVIPPIGFESGNVVFMPGVIDRCNDKIIAGMQRARGVAIECRVTALVFADFLPVDPE